MKIIGVIPARYHSTRFPGKPLAMILGKSMIRRVYEQAMKANCLSGVTVATDDDRIFSHVTGFGGKAVMTSPNHKSGTERCGEVLEKHGSAPVDAVINIQGDEPFIDPGQIDKVGSLLKGPDTEIATLARMIETEEEIHDPNTVKVVINEKQNALYFSRAPIPYVRSAGPDQWKNQKFHYKHIGIYGYKANVLREILKLPESYTEKAESLEQLRWLSGGYEIRVGITSSNSNAVDHPCHLSKFTNKP
jgi:3-deoxy-manno-octulosonate cytidylyltransferase (CMP-KDO synthetase)